MKELASLLLYAAPLVLVAMRRVLPDLLGLTEHAPDPVIVAVAIAALRFPKEGACLFAAAAGLLGDLPSGTPFGLGGARLALVAIFASSLRRHVDLGVPFVPSLAVLTLALLDRAIAAIVLDACQDVRLLPLLARGALDATASVALVPLLWPAGELLHSLTRATR